MRLPRLLLVAALLLGTGLAAAPAAHADDYYEIDLRLQDEGFAEAYTEVHEALRGDGFRLAVDYESDSRSRQAYEQEARALAEVLWDHLDGRLLAVDVVPTAEVPWTPDGLPPAVSFVRADLETAFGPRPAGLDEGDVFGEDPEAGGELPLDEVDLETGLGLVVLLVGLGVLLLLGLGVAVVVLLVRGRPAPAPAWGGWPGPATWPAAGPGWAPPPAAPPSAPAYGPDAPYAPAPPPPGTPGSDPWAAPPGR